MLLLSEPAFAASVIAPGGAGRIAEVSCDVLEGLLACQTCYWGSVIAPGGQGDLDKGEAATPLGAPVQQLLQRQKLQLDALEQVHVIHAHQHRLAFELRGPEVQMAPVSVSDQPCVALQPSSAQMP